MSQIWMVRWRPGHGLADWAMTLALSLSTALIIFITYWSGGTHEHTWLDWCFLPVVLGAMLLGPLQVLLVGLSFYVYSGLAILLDAGVLVLYPGFDLLMRPLALTGLVWIAELRKRTMRQQNQLQAQRNQLQSKLNQSLQMSLLSHELRQPLAQLQLQVRLLLHKLESEALESDPDALRSGLQIMFQAGVEIETAVQAMVRLSHRRSISPAPWDLVACVRDCLAAMKTIRDSESIGLSVDLPSSPLLVNLDRSQMVMVLRNLLTNAREALLKSDPGHRYLEVRLCSRQGRVHLSVADSGPGLKTRNLQDLVLMSSKPDGMGLGLLTVQAFTRANGGRVALDCSSTIGGAEILLDLPCFSLHSGTSFDRELPGESIEDR